MSGNATTRSTDRERSRARSAAARQPVAAPSASDLQPPVLFRFPAIAMPVAAEYESPGPISAAIEADVNGSQDAHARTHASLSSAPPAIETRSSERAAEQSAPASVAANVATNFASPPTESAQVSAAASVPLQASDNLASSASNTAPQSSAASSAAPTRTWWEHWSSGVVLILLVIALVTASIVALNDGSPSGNQPLASELETAAVDEFDLSGISIPDIGLGSLGSSSPAGIVAVGTQPPVDTSGASSVESIAENATVVGGPLPAVGSPSLGVPAIEPSSQQSPLGPQLLAEVPVAPPAFEATASDGTATAGQLPGSQLPGSQLPGSQLGSLELSSAELQAATAASISSNSTEYSVGQMVATPQATLASPIGVMPPQLFANGSTQGEPSVNNSLITIPASGPTATLSMPLPTGASSDSPSMSTAAGNVLAPGTATPGAGSPNTPGASPTLYDGAAYGGELHASTALNSQGMVDTNLPSFSAMLASNRTGVALSTEAGASPSNGTVFTTAAHSQVANAPAAANPSGNMQAQPPSAPVNTKGGIIPSSTPESDSDAMIRAYLKFQELNRAATADTSNRYGAAGTINGGTTTGGTTSGRVASGAGFTLGSPQTVTGPATAPAR